MRKKSHILLARYIADQMDEAQELQNHRKAFCLGSILPDIRPSFLTIKHEFGGTFEELKKKMCDLTVDCELDDRNKRIYWRQLGEVIHYVADYFTFPHNHTFDGTLVEHGKYENDLKHGLKKYILTGQAEFHAEQNVKFESIQHLFEFIHNNHSMYLGKERNVTEDIKFIVSICYQAAQGLFELMKVQYPGNTYCHA